MDSTRHSDEEEEEEEEQTRAGQDEEASEELETSEEGGSRDTQYSGRNVVHHRTSMRRYRARPSSSLVLVSISRHHFALAASATQGWETRAQNTFGPNVSRDHTCWVW